MPRLLLTDLRFRIPRLFFTAVLSTFCIASYAQSADSAVDRGFSAANLRPRTVSARELHPLQDGGAVVMVPYMPGHSIYLAYYHVSPNGQVNAQPVWTTSGPPFEPQGIAAIFRDGSLFMTAPPYRRDAQGAVISSFTGTGLDSTKAITTAAQQSDGRLLVAQGGSVVRLSPQGVRDLTFSAPPSLMSSIRTLSLDSAGRVIVHGWDTNNHPSTVRLFSTGSRDEGFGSPAGALVGVASEGAIVTATSVVDISTRVTKRRYTRYRSDGAVDTAWNIQTWAADASAVAMAPTGELYVGYSGLGVLRLTAGDSPQVDPNFFSASGPNAVVESMAVLPDGKLLVLGQFTQWDGFATADLVRLDPAQPLAVRAPIIAFTNRVLPRPDARVVVQANAIGSGPFTYSWTSLDGGTLPADIHTPLLVFDSFQRANLGRYALQVTGAGGTTTATIDLRPKLAPRLANVSSRAAVGSGEDVLIVGVALATGAPGYNLLLRGAGPSLAQFGVNRPLENPLLTLRDESGGMVARNDDWVDDQAARTAVNQAGAFPFAAGSRDSVIVRPTAGANYTLALEDTGNRSGTGLIEVYDVYPSHPMADDAARGTLINLSVRGRVAETGEPLIAGFVIEDPAAFGRAMKVLIRVVGPTLSEFGVAAPLADSRLAVYDAAGREIASNDNWATSANADETATDAAKAGAFALPRSSKDAALSVELPPGAYTVRAASANSAAGIALVEIYRVP